MGTKDAALARAFGDRLRQLREKAGLPQADLAARMGKQIQAVSRYESGTRVPTLALLYQLAKALGCKPCDLLPPAKRRKK